MGGNETDMKVNEVPLPKNVPSLPKDSTLVKVAYSALNPVDYDMPAMPLAGRILNRMPCSDFAGTVIS